MSFRSGITDLLQGINLYAPSDEVAEEFNVNYNEEYWGTDAPIWAAFGPKKPPQITSMTF